MEKLAHQVLLLAKNLDVIMLQNQAKSMQEVPGEGL